MEIIGQAASRITPGTLSLEPEVPWKRVVLMRHVLVHDHYRIDVPTVWSTAQDDLGPLKGALMRPLLVLPSSVV